MPEIAGAIIKRPPRTIGAAVRACPICRSADLNYEFIVGGYPVCRCAHCTLLFLNPPPGPAESGTDATGPPMQNSVYELHAANAVSRLDQLVGYAGPELRRVLMITNDDFLTVEAGRRQLDVVSMSSTQIEAGALLTLSSAP